jgi:hypothetical protein
MCIDGGMMLSMLFRTIFKKRKGYRNAGTTTTTPPPSRKMQVTPISIQQHVGSPFPATKYTSQVNVSDFSRT